MHVNASWAGFIHLAPDLTFQVDGVERDWLHLEDGLCVEWRTASQEVFGFSRMIKKALNATTCTYETRCPRHYKMEPGHFNGTAGMIELSCSTDSHWL